MTTYEEKIAEFPLLTMEQARHVIRYAPDMIMRSVITRKYALFVANVEQRRGWIRNGQHVQRPECGALPDL